MVSLEGLSKIVDPSQLTADFDGSLEYNHDDWIEVWLLSRTENQHLVHTNILSLDLDSLNIYFQFTFFFFIFP